MEFTPTQLANYWSKKLTDLIWLLHTQDSGLTDSEALLRLKNFGANSLSRQKNSSLLSGYLKKFFDPLILILLLASIISAALGEVTEFIIISLIIITSATIDFYQQYSADQAALKLQKKVALRASVIRGGRAVELDVSGIVPGDLLSLRAGDIVPADCRLLESKELMVNQATLTGESFPQPKNAQAVVREKAELAERLNCLFMGTNLVSGEGKAVVVFTGEKTEFGKISQLLKQTRPETAFSLSVRNFGFLLLKTTLVLVIVVFFINAGLRHDVLNSFLFALSLAVGLTPELLPVIISINLAKGALRMEKKGVIVKDLPAIENFGGMSVLCTDKTGTLTEDHISLEIYEDIDGKNKPLVLSLGFLNSYFQTGIKSPMEEAILKHQEALTQGYKKVNEILFDFQRKYLSVIAQKGKQLQLITKGAPENVLPLCVSYQRVGKILELDKIAIKKINQRFESLSNQGFRVLAVAIKQVKPKLNYSTSDEAGLTFVGLMAFLDPPKQSAKEALNILRSRGIEIKILTGDNELVTRKICQDLGMVVRGVLTGVEMEKLDDLGLINVIPNTTIFSRLNPEQKQRIILNLKNLNEVVGFLGDGINDAPGLRIADIGISVDNAVDVAKESADLILLHKDLHVLKDGVYEGRKTYGNIMKYIMMGTSSNFGNMFSVAGASIFLPFLPMLPVQILLNNLIYDLSQLFISSDKVDEEFLEKPKRWNISFIKHFMLVFGPISSIFDFLTFGILLYLFKAGAPLFQTGWFLESLITQTLIILSIRTKMVPFFKSRTSNLLLSSIVAVVFLGLLLPLLPVGKWLSFVIPPLSFYLFLPAIIVIYFLIVEFAKKWFYQRYEI